MYPKNKLMKVIRSCKISNKKLVDLLNTRYFTLKSTSTGTRPDQRQIVLPAVLILFLFYTKLGKKEKIEIIVELSILLSEQNINGRQSFYNEKKETDVFDIE
jgi:hypothetical protein